MSGREVSAVVFDLDGVLVDSELLRLELTRLIIAPAELLEEDYLRFIGTRGFAEWLAGRCGIAPQEIRRRFDRALDAHLAGEGLDPVDGARELLSSLEARGRRLAVASQSDADTIARMLRATGLAHHFSVVCSAQHVRRAKPAPDVYLRAAAMLDVEPADCIAVEDSPHGVQAALEAGMTVVQARQTRYPFPPQPGAASVVDSLRDFDLDWLDRAPAPR